MSSVETLPRALTEHVGYLAVVLGQQSQSRFETAMSTLNLRPIHYDYLATLNEAREAAQKDLAHLLEVDAARIVALTDELEARDLVQRKVDPSDRRRNLVSLTRSGRALVAKAARLADEVQADLLKGISAADQRTLRALLQKVTNLG